MNMKYAIVINGSVANLAKSDYPLESNWIEAGDFVDIGDLWDGQSFSKPQDPGKSPEEVEAEIVAATQKRLDDFAVTRKYDDIKSASDYAGCSVPKFSAEGTYCRDARAETWAKLYEMLAEVEAGTRPMPTSFADVEPELPPLIWPV